MNANQTAATSRILRTLTTDDLRSQAPSVFALEPWHKMSGRYKFVPTIDVVGMLADKGFLPVRAQQSASRIDGKGEFTRHMLRFRHADTSTRLAELIRPGHHEFLRNTGVPDVEFPELVLVNSHDGTSGYQFSAGIFRLACYNGLIVQSATHGSISVRHTGGSDFHDRVIDATFSIMDDSPKTMGQIEEWKGLALPPPVQDAFAQASAELRDTVVPPAELLRGRRAADHRADDGTRSLWATFNVVQENMTKGGIRTVNPETHRRATTRPIKSVDADLKTNRALWMLTERMAELVASR